MRYGKTYRIKADYRTEQEFNKLGRREDYSKKRYEKREQSKENAQKTIESRSPEVLERIKKYEDQKNEQRDLHIKSKENMEKNWLPLKTKLLEEAKRSNPQTAIAMYSNELESFEQDCANYNATMTAYNKNTQVYDKNYKYLQFLSELYKENLHFCLYLPIEGVLYSVPPLQKNGQDILNKEEMQLLELKLEEEGAFNLNHRYYGSIKTHLLKYFPSKIDRISELKDIIFCLKRDASKYTVIKNNLLNDCTCLYYDFLKVVNEVPEVLAYFEKEDYKQLKELDLYTFGKKIYRNPDLIKLFNADFLNDISVIENLFSCVPRSKIYSTFGNRLNKFPLLKKYAERIANNPYDKDVYTSYTDL